MATHLKLFCLCLVFLCAASIVSATPSIYPSSVSCGNKVVGEPGANHLEISIRNSSIPHLHFTGSGIALTGPDAADFSITVMPSLEYMNAGEVRYLTIAFAPQSLGNKSAFLVITTDSATTPEVTVPITGDAVAPRGSTVTSPYTGYGPGQSTIGPGGHYSSITAAAQDISSTPLTGGDWTFLILDDLTETNNSIIGQQSTNGHTITFRPAPGTTPTVTFTTTTQNLDTFGSWPGHILIGAELTNDTGNWRLRPRHTHNIIIDGSDIAGTDSRSLTFQNKSGTGATALVHVNGNCDNIQLRNCNFLYEPPGYLSSPPAVIDFAAINNFPGHPGIPPDEVPDFGVVTNCFISTAGTGPVLYPAISINYRAISSPPYHIDPGSRGIQITSNTITNLYYGMRVNFCADALISSNSLHLDIDEPPYRNQTARTGISCQINMPEDGATTTSITGNLITFSGDGTTSKSVHGIIVASQDTANAIFVTNNMISGLTAPHKAKSTFSLNYGILNSSDNLCTVTIAHNSISFTEHADALGTASRCAAIANSVVNQYFAGNTIIRNNIIRMGTPGSAAIMSLPTPEHLEPSTIISDHNVIYTAPGAIVAYEFDGSNSLYYESLEEWRAASGQDGESMDHDPFVPAAAGMGTWVGPTGSGTPDMHFTSYPGDAYQMPAVPGVTQDFDRDPRPGPLAIAGADEITPGSSSVGEWSLY